MPERKTYKLDPDTEYRGMAGDKEVTIKTDSSGEYTTGSEREQHVLEQNQFKGRPEGQAAAAKEESQSESTGGGRKK